MKLKLNPMLLDLSKVCPIMSLYFFKSISIINKESIGTKTNNIISRIAYLSIE